MGKNENDSKGKRVQRRYTPPDNNKYQLDGERVCELFTFNFGGYVERGGWFQGKIF